MSSLLQWLASERWAHVVAALLHTLWIGALTATALYFRLRRGNDPFLRYRACIAALGVTLAGGLVAWSVIDGGEPIVSATIPAAAPAAERALSNEPVVAQGSVPAGRVTAMAAPGQSGYPTAWLALAWMTGALLVLARAAVGVAEAEKIRRAGRPLADPVLLRMVEQARLQLGVVRRLRVVTTEKLTSPAVIGILVPSLVLPLSLVTSVPAAQLQFILLHELAHVRRGDYLANLLQFVVEAVLFFNPAVWWMSRQVRLEREACCDALAAGSAEDRVEYARALALVAERSLEPLPAAAAAFGDRHRPFALKDRIQRLLVPGYRPALRLTWKALFSSLLLGSLLLMVSALGTQWAVSAAANLLTPRQRIERIEQAMKHLGQFPAESADGSGTEVELTATVRTADGAPVPSGTYGVFHSRKSRHSSSIGVGPDAQGSWRAKVPAGDITFAVMAEGYAPGCSGPVQIEKASEPPNFEVVLERGFALRVNAVDAETRAPIPEAPLSCQFWMASSSIGAPRRVATDASGVAFLTNCGPVRLRIALEKPGYERVELTVERPAPGVAVELAAHRALPIAGLVMDTAGTPISEASLFVLRAEGAPGIYGGDPARVGAPLAVTGADGRFRAAVLPRGGSYWLFARAPGHADVILNNVRAGQTNLQAVLGPELRVRGRITGNVDELEKSSGRPVISFANEYKAGDRSNMTAEQAEVTVTNGAGYFEFVSPIAGVVRITAGKRLSERRVVSSIDDWEIHLGPLRDEEDSRTVTLRFVHPSGVPPTGTVTVLLPDTARRYVTAPGDAAAAEGAPVEVYANKQLEIVDGAVSFKVPVGSQFSFEPGRTIGYWFPPQYSIAVSNTGPGEIRVPVTPAGAIYAQAREPGGDLARNVSFSVKEIVRSPLSQGSWPVTPSTDSWSADGPPRKFVASCLPLGGTYRVIAWQGNNFAISEPVELTEASPDRSVELSLITGGSIAGRILGPDGRPAVDATLELSWDLEGSGFGLPTKSVDPQGQFVFLNCNPDVGQYSVTVRSPEMRSQRLPVPRVGVPVELVLQPGRRCSGQVVEAVSGRGVVDVEVRLMPQNGQGLTEKVGTDKEGKFEFSSLADFTYLVFVDGCQVVGERPMVVGREEPRLTLRVKPYTGSRVRLADAR